MSKRPLFFGLIFSLLLLAFIPGVASAATIYVNSSTGNDTTGDGTSGAPYKTFHKGYTMASANDTIDLTGTFDWTSADETGDATTSGYTISKNLTIQGQGAQNTIVQAASSDNTATRRVFTIANGVTATIKNLMIRYGKVGSSQYGGGIDVVGTAVIDGCDINYNRATDGGGGGVNVWGTATVKNSTVRYNVASYMGGGLNRHYYTNGNGTPNAANFLNIENSTITNNTVTQTVAYLEGGGVFYRRGEGAITNSVITLNQVTGTTGASTNGLGTGDGAGTISIKNSIIAANVLGSSAGDIGHRENGYGVYADNGGNIFGRRGFYSGGLTVASTSWIDSNTYNGSIDGTYVLQNGTGLTSGSLSMSSTLALNSSSIGTMTFAITSASSIAVNNGIPGTNGATSTVPTLDQRGASRNSTVDIGVYEYDGAGLSDSTAPTVSVTAPASGATVYGGSVSLTATASDDVEVSGVKFYVDGTMQGSEDTSSPYSINWDSTATTTGSHSVFAVARDSSNNYATSTSVSFLVDNTGPVISALATSTATTTITLSWTTDEAASTKINFGVLSSFGTTTSEMDTSPRVTSHTYTISGLNACTYYYLQARSVDAYANVSTSNTWARTLGCTGSAPVSATNDGAIETASGGSVVQGVITITVPTSFTSTSTAAVFQAHQLDVASFSAAAGAPSGKTRVSDKVFRLTALTDATTTLSTFTNPITVAFTYSDSDVSGVDESTLRVYRYDGSTWNVLSGCSINTGANSVSCTTTAFSDFAVFGDPSSSNGGDGGSSSPAANGPIHGVRIGFNLTDYLGDVSSTHVFVVAEQRVSSVEVSNASEIPANSATTTVSSFAPVPHQTTYKRDLWIGSVGSDVKEVQKMLNYSGFQVAKTGVGSPGNETDYYGQKTAEAMRRFQEAHAEFILKPAGLTSGTGYFGSATRKYIEGLRF